MSKYDKSIAISHEEEGSYHRREVEHRPRSPVTTTTTTSYPVTRRYVERHHQDGGKPSRALANHRAGTSDDDDDPDNFEEWTTSKRKVNHKTRQVETRVSRQLLVRGGEVIADSGPQVTTRIKEDNKVEECEKEKTPKNKSRFEALEGAPEAAEACGLVLGEKKEIQRVSREVREENMQYHDERFKELTGKDVHRRAIQAPHELITINDKSHSGSSSSKPRGKMIHYSNKGKKYQDTDEILEVAKLAIDGSITKEVKRTKHHEEFSEDELPDEKGEAEQLRRKPVVERSSRRHADYVNDFDQVDAEPGEFSAVQRYDSDAGSPVRSRKAGYTSAAGQPGRSRRAKDDEAFPRYEIDPLLNSLRDEDFKPMTSSYDHQRPSGRHVEHSVERSNQRARHSSSSAGSSICDEQPQPQQHRGRARNSHLGGHRSPSSSPVRRVEVPEEYRVNKQRLMSGRAGAGSSLSHKSNRSQQHRRREDAATQARLTDEEVERRSLRSNSASLDSHEKTAKYLERQSTANSSRHYYYGDSHRRSAHKAAAGKTQPSKRPTSLSSSSSSLSSVHDDARTRARKQGVQSRDSGFKSPHSNRTETPMSPADKQIYAVSKKSHSDNKHRSSDRPGAVSPTESVGQRSVKTTTTTLSAGLADRPLVRGDEKENRKSSRKQQQQQQSRGKSGTSDKIRHETERTDIKRRQRSGDDEDEHRSEADLNSANKAYDTISVSSLQSPNATKIKVPYQRIIEIERERANNQRVAQQASQSAAVLAPGREPAREKSSSEMSFQEDIENLSKRLASISQRQPSADGQANRSAPLKHFDYKTIVAEVQPAVPKQVIGSYNVHIQHQDSPFRSVIQTGKGTTDNQPSTTAIIMSTNQHHRNEQTNTDNNNEANFSLDNYVKYRATPALVETSLQSLSGTEQMDDEDRMSVNSSCSLQSARTYNIRKLDSKQGNIEGNELQSNEVETKCEPTRENADATSELVFDENATGKPTAWIFDPRDNSSTAIVTPVRPKQPETPQIDSKTEELGESRGGRSYYLELVESNPKAARPSSVDSLYSRWNSQGALHLASSNGRAPTLSSTRTNLNKQQNSFASQNMLASSQAKQEKASADTKSTGKSKSIQQRRQLPYGGPPASLGDRSKSSSCLLSVTKPSKYSIYGGLRKPNESSKPVPRLSYSRAIGPRSSRVDTTPTAPSRYLKMR